MSLPPDTEPPSSATLAPGADDETCTQLARERGLRVVGPSRHAYLDVVDEVVAASNLTPFDGRPRDAGVLVAPARWRAQRRTRASPALADRLGFEPWCWQLALR